MDTINKDSVLGLMYAVIGGGYAWYTLATLPVGTPLNMGPGYFPLGLCAILGIFGVWLIGKGLFKGKANLDIASVPFAAIIYISVSIAAFSLLIRGAGLFPTVFVTAVIAAMASKRRTMSSILLTPLVLASLSVLLFIYAIGLPIGAFGYWVR